MLSSNLTIKKFSLNINLGVSAAERKSAQPVTIDITITFPKLPAACTTDNINDTLCYHRLTDTIQEFCQNHEFKLIEHLGHQIYQLIKSNIPKNHQLQLTVTKQPPLANVGEATFFIGD